jgi:phosphohistidine phosphatase
MISLIIVRHGEAEPKIDSIEDKERKLIKKGVKQMRRVAGFIDEMDYSFDRVFSSTYIRAYQSAEVILDELGEDEKKIETITELEPDKDPSEFINKIKENDNASILIVGHEPFLSQLVRNLTGGNVEIKKGGLVVIDYNPVDGKGILKTLVTQKIMKLI